MHYSVFESTRIGPSLWMGPKAATRKVRSVQDENDCREFNDCWCVTEKLWGGVGMSSQTYKSVEEGWRYRGYDAIMLDNQWFHMIVLPGKGCDILRCVYKPENLLLTWSTAWGLRPKGTASGFMDNYEGGFQIVFPNGGTAAHYQGADFDQHGDVNLLPWRTRTCSRPDKLIVRGEVDSVQMPFHCERSIILWDNQPRITLETAVTNTGRQRLPFMLGEHLVFGPPFLEPEGGEVDMPKGISVIADNDTLSRTPWPYAVSGGQSVDLRELPAVGSPSDIFYLTDFPVGQFRVWRKHSAIGVEVRWDPLSLPYVWFWREFGRGGAPWYGRHYNIGLEPFTSYPTRGLPVAVNNGSAAWSNAGETRTFAIDLDVVTKP